MNRTSATQAKYDKGNTRKISFKLNLKTDADILSWLDQQPNKQGAFKDAIRDKIKRAG